MSENSKTDGARTLGTRVRDWGDSSLGHTNRKQVRVDRLLTLFVTPLYCIKSKCGAGFLNENVLIS